MTLPEPIDLDHLPPTYDLTSGCFPDILLTFVEAPAPDGRTSPNEDQLQNALSQFDSNGDCRVTFEEAAARAKDLSVEMKLKGLSAQSLSQTHRKVVQSEPAYAPLYANLIAKQDALAATFFFDSQRFQTLAEDLQAIDMNLVQP